MSNIKCPKCGSKDFRQETDYSSTTFDLLLRIGSDIVKGFFRGLRPGESMSTGLQEQHYMISGTEYSKYRCNRCGHVWK